MSTEKITLRAPSLGATLHGSLDKKSDIALFKGIPYANVSTRWTHSKTAHTLDDEFDATRFGYRCNQLDGMVLVSGGTNDDLPGDDEFKCLNLNIAIPNEALEDKNKSLPVMVWIHG
jgi:carboxylesterase type B